MISPLKKFYNQNSLAILVIILCSWLIYGQVLNHDFVNYDDDGYVYLNPHVKKGMSLDGLRYAFTTMDKGNLIPLTWLSHMMDVEIFGLSPGGHHFTNLFFHILNSLLLFCFLNNNTRSFYLSLIVALLFAVHPLHVESVAWISERKDVLSAFWGLAALITYSRYSRNPSIISYSLSVLLFLAGLLSKPMLVTLPLIFCLIDFWPLRRVSAIKDFFRPRNNQTVLIEKIPFFIFSLIFSMITIVSQESAGALETLTGIPFSLRLMNAVISYAEYILKLFWPANLSVIYPYRYEIRGYSLVISMFVLLIISAGVSFAWRKNAALLIGWLWFLITLLPVIGLIQVGTQAMADRYTYIPSIGFFICVVWLLESLFLKFNINKRIFHITTAAAITIYSIMAWRQASIWRDGATLFNHALSITNDNWVAHLNYGEALIENGRVDAAIKQYERAIAIKPDFELAYLNMGVAFAQNGDPDKAIEYYEKALMLKKKMPEAWVNLGNAYLKKGKPDQALAQYLTALEYQTNYAAAYRGIGAVMAGRGDLEKALRAFKIALEIDPESTLAKDSIHRIETRLKNHPEN